MVSGPGSGDPGDTLTFTVEVQEDGSAASGKTVTFGITSGDGNASLNPTSATTGSNGQASTSLTLGNSASGSYTVTAMVGTISTSGTATIEAKQQNQEQQQQESPPPSQFDLTVSSSPTPWSAPITASVSQNGNPVEGQTVTFSITSSGDGKASLSATRATTGSNGEARVTLNFESGGSGSYEVTASVGTNSASITVERPRLPIVSIIVVPPGPRLTISVISFLGSGEPGETLTFIVEVRVDDSPASGKTVTFSVSPDDGTASLGTTSATTGSDGRAQTTLTPQSGASGSYTVTASVDSKSTSSTVIIGTSPPPELSISVVSGPGSGDPGDALTFTVEVQEGGSAASGKTVTFSITSGDGNASLNPISATTGSNGQASTTLTLGNNASGSYTVTAMVGTISTSGTATIEEKQQNQEQQQQDDQQQDNQQQTLQEPVTTLLLPKPTGLESISGGDQEGLPGETLANAFVVEVRDVNDNRLKGVVVRFAVTAGSGSLSSEMVMTNENGQAESTLTLGSEPGTNTVEASVEGIPHIAVFNIVSGDNQTGPMGEVPVSMYWLERGEASGIRRATPDDAGINRVVTRGLQQPAELALDVVNRKVYWTDIKAKAIRRANLDGTGVQDVVTVGLNTPNGVALDVTGEMVYWTDWGAKKIQRANFDGTGLQDLVTNRLSLLGGIALDVAGGTMYWVDFGRDTIWRANLDGTEVEALVTAGLSIPFAIALDVAGGKMYWADKGTDKIQRANLDGTGVQDLLTKAQGIDNPNGIAIDVASGTMYWTESSKGKGKIKSANLDGSNVQTLFADRDDPRSIALDIPLPPDAMPTAMSKPQPPSTPDAPAKPEDVNDDGVVDGKDILVVVQHFGKTGEHMADVNGDGVVNLADIAQVALALDDGAAAPLARVDALDVITPERVRQWLTQAKLAGANQEAILALEQLLSLLTPKQTALHPNYPNPFNPETWIPYHLANDTDVQISIYDISGALVRQLNLGHQRAGNYTQRSRAAYWDGRNGVGEHVASGVYFYTLTADDFTATRKMLVGK